MGEIADMMLDGTLCEQCGVVMEDHETLGYSRLCQDCEGDKVSLPFDRVRCPYCTKIVKATGLKMHLHDAHDVGPSLTKVRCEECGKKVKSNGLEDHMRDAHGL